MYLPQTHLYWHNGKDRTEQLLVDQGAVFVFCIELDQSQANPSLLRVPLVSNDLATTLFRRVNQAHNPIVCRGVDHLTEELGLSWLVVGSGRVEFSQCALQGGHELGNHVLWAENVVGVGAHLGATESLDG